MKSQVRKYASAGRVGLKDGNWIQWYDDTLKQSEGSYDKGIKNGEWINEFIYDELGICDAVAYKYSSQIDKDRLN